MPEWKMARSNLAVGMAIPDGLSTIKMIGNALTRSLAALKLAVMALGSKFANGISR